LDNKLGQGQPYQRFIYENISGKLGTEHGAFITTDGDAKITQIFRI